MVLFVVGNSSPLQAAERPDLTKTEAKKILENWGHANVHIYALVEGAGEVAWSGNPNSVRVIASSTFNGIANGIELVLSYDKELGWFMYAFDVQFINSVYKKTLYIANKKGVKEIPIN